MENVWNGFVSQPFGGFILIFIGTLLLFAEVLVKGRFILGLVGLASITIYFIPHIQEGQALWMGGLYLLGILLIILDGKFIGDGTIGGIGLILMLVALAIPSPTILYGIAVITAFLLGAIGSFYFLKILPKRELWSKLALKDALTSEKGYNSINEGYTLLKGKEGTAETDFRPSGTIEIEGQMYSAVSDGRWIEKGSRVKVTDVSGTRIMVVAIEED